MIDAPGTQICKMRLVLCSDNHWLIFLEELGQMSITQFVVSPCIVLAYFLSKFDAQYIFCTGVCSVLLEQQHIIVDPSSMFTIPKLRLVVCRICILLSLCALHVKKMFTSQWFILSDESWTVNACSYTYLILTNFLVTS